MQLVSGYTESSGERNVGWESAKTRVSCSHFALRGGTRTACIAGPRSQESLWSDVGLLSLRGLQGSAGGWRAFLGFCVGEGFCGICKPFPGGVAKEASVDQAAEFQRQSCSFFTGCVVSR